MTHVPLRRVEAEVYASHAQFYVADGEAGEATADVWDGAGLERRLGVTHGLVAVGTIGYTFLPVALELWPGEPPADVEAWDHVVEAPLEVATGRIALAGVEGPAELQPVAVEPGAYRVRSAAAGLADATEMDGGDRYRIQVWSAAAAPPRVLRWWPPWDPAGVRPQPSGGGRLLVGAEAEDARVAMHWLASRGRAHLFVDDGDVLWEHSNLPDAMGTPQLEELSVDGAERRYGPRSGWEQTSLDPAARSVLRSLWQSAVGRRGSRET